MSTRPHITTRIEFDPDLTDGEARVYDGADVDKVIVLGTKPQPMTLRRLRAVLQEPRVRASCTCESCQPVDYECAICGYKGRAGRQTCTCGRDPCCCGHGLAYCPVCVGSESRAAEMLREVRSIVDE